MSQSSTQNIESGRDKPSASPQDAALMNLQSEINSLRRDKQGSSQFTTDQQGVNDQLHKLGVLPSLSLVSDSDSGTSGNPIKDNNSGDGSQNLGHSGDKDHSGGRDHHDHDCHGDHRPGGEPGGDRGPGGDHQPPDGSGDRHKHGHHHGGHFRPLQNDIAALTKDAPTGDLSSTQATTDLQNLNNDLHRLGLPSYMQVQDTGGTTSTPENPITNPTPTSPENPITNPTPTSPENPITNPTPTSPEPVTTTTPTESPTGQFTVKNGEIIGPDGKQFIPKGIAVGGAQAIQDESTILKDFPGLNAIRYTATPTGEYYWNSSETPTAKSPTIAQTEQFINDMTKKGIVVEIDDMDSEPNQIITQSAMDAQKKWVGQLAADEKNNPYVWFQTPNEPNNKKNSNASVVAEQVGYYNAVRDAGNNNLVTLEETQSGTLAPMLADKAAYADMSNVAFDLHAYNFTDSKVSAKIAATDAITSEDGKIPVFFGEYGDTYPNGKELSPDINGSLAAVQDSGVGGLAWSFRNIGGTTEINQLTLPDGGLTPYGKEVAAYIAE